MSEIVVAGSCNMDLIISVNSLPDDGETIMGHKFMTSPGGKGANQAVAAARSGAIVHFIGAVGNDEFGTSLKKDLQSEGVDCGKLHHLDSSSGVALITVSNDGENTIVLSSGANDMVEPAMLDNCKEVFERAQVALFQLEIPLETVLSGLKLAKSQSCITIFDPAPAMELPEEIWSYVDITVPNEGEIFKITGCSSIEDGAVHLLKKGVTLVVVTRGAMGVSVFTSDDTFEIPSFKVKVIDSVGAGDAFSGALAVAKAEDKSLHNSILYASAAGALACRSLGARSSMASRSEIETFLRQNSISN